MKIYRNAIEVYDLSVDTKTVVKRRLMVENTLNVTIAVSRSTPLDIRIGDYFDMGAERYMVLDEPTYSLRGEVYDYSILLRGNLHRLEVYLMPDDGTEEWWYYGRVVEQIDKVVAALNTKESGWSVVYPDVSELADNEAKNINYANMSILSALHAICSAENGWAMEFDIEGKVIHFARQIKTPTELRFEYGRGKGLYELTRGELSGEKVNTRLYAYGGTANMPNAHRLSMVDVNDGLDYVEKNVAQYGLRETRINFDHIYPRRNSTITRDAQIVEEGKANWTVVDTAMDFDLNNQIVEEPVIIFTSGDCAGAEFVIVKYDDTTKTITFKESVDDSGAEPYILPNASRYPKSGDQYAFVNILMPDSYVAAAKAELKQAAIEEINKQSIPKRSYSVKCDPRYIGTLAARPKAGDECRIIDTPNGVDYSARIVGYEHPLIEPNNISLTIADKIAIPSAVVLAKSVKEVKTKLSALDKGQLTESYLRKVFHPLGGRENLDLTTKQLAATERITTPEIVSPDFQSGIVRAGYKISTDPQTKRSTLEVGRVIADELLVDLLTHQRVQSIGGVLIVSQAWADIVRVENLGSAYRCFYIPEDGAQLWRTGDQALCKDAGKYYWRYVSSVSDQPNVEGEHWLNLSVATADGSGVPADGDEIVLLGHRGVDTTRQGATIISSGTLGYADPFVHYGGINSFSLAGKQRTVIGDNSRFVGSSFTIVAPDGSLNRIPRDCGGWTTGRSEYYDRVSHKGSMWLCVASDGTTVEPSDAAEGVWLKQVEQGSKGDYLVQGYCWAENKPQRPVGSSPEGWSAGSDRGVAIVDESVDLLTDEPVAPSNVALEPYPASYRLWGSTATFDGATGEVVGEWSDPYQVSGEVGADGQTPIIYSLAPSATAVKKDKAGVVSPANVSCRAMIKIGNEREIIGVDPKIDFKGRNWMRGTTSDWLHSVAHSPLTAATTSFRGQTMNIQFDYDNTENNAPTYFDVYVNNSWVWGLSHALPATVGIHEISYTFVMPLDANSIQIVTSASAGNLKSRNQRMTIGSEPHDYQPAPEDYAIQRNGEAYVAGAAVTPSDTVNWTLHDPAKPTTAEPIDRASTIFSEDIEVGGVNLALNSKRGWRSTGYNILHENLSEDWVVGQTYTITVKGTINSSNQFGLWRDNGSQIAGILTPMGNNIHRLTFVCPVNHTSQPLLNRFTIYNVPSATSTLATIEWIKIERGNRATDWSPAPEDTQAEINGLAQGFGFKTQAELSAYLAAPSKGPIFNYDPVTGVLALSSLLAENIAGNNAFVNNLTVGKLKTVRPEGTNQGIDIIGDQINIFDNSAKVVATLTGAQLPEIKEFNSDGSSGSRELDSFSRTTSGTQSYPAQIFSGIGAGSIIHVITTLQASAAPGNNFFNPPVMAGMAFVDLVLMRRANPSSAWSDYETLANCGGFNSVSVDRQITVSDSGDYSLQFRCVATPNSNGQSSSVSVGATQFLYNYLDSSNMMSWYCGNGFGLRGNKDNYVHISFLNKIMSMVVKGNFDAPGVLAKAHISSANAISKKWGKDIYQVTSATTAGANKLIRHKVLNGTYSAIVTPMGRGVIAEVINEANGYVEVYATGAFNLTLVGDNK